MSSHKEFDHLVISLEDVVKATNNFADENLIGEGGFGKVYKGNLIWKGESKNIAARRLHLNHDYGQGDMEFWREVMLLSSLKHENVVSIVGFCNYNDEKIIINELEPMGSLDKYLCGSTLSWVQRLEICVGVAHALKYIHYDDRRDFSVIHRNIKSSKVLLDDNWRPKLSGFEISIKITKARRNRLLLDEVIGTIGYVDPTYEKAGFVSHKSDVFSLGVVLFVVLCGRKAFISLGDHVSQVQPSQSKRASTKRRLSSFIKVVPMILSKVFCGRKGFLVTPAGIDPQISSVQDDKKQENMEEMAVSPNLPTTLSAQKAELPSIDEYMPISAQTQLLPIVHEDQSLHQDQMILLALSREAKPLLSAKKRMEKPFGEFRLPKSIEDGILPLDQLRQPADDRMAFSFNEEKPSSFTNVNPSSFSSVKASSFRDTPFSSNNGQPSSLTNVQPIESWSSNKSFTKNPMFTMKRLAQYSHSPNEEILAQLGKLRYEAGELDDLIDEGLRKQMDERSFEIFSETAYTCINEQRALRPNIDQIIAKLEKALELQRLYELSKDSAGDEGGLSDRLKKKNLEHLEFQLEDIKSATKNFSETCLIGSGGYGNVYKAELYLPTEGKRKTVAIKRILVREDKHGEEGFVAEIDLLTSCKHPNIVYLYGFCVEDSHMILVYDHVSNGSLDDYLGSSEKLTNLSWVQRLKICIDIAQGLNYLHTRTSDERKILHRDIKSGNILLGKNWEAKIADFGLSRFHHDEDPQANTIYTKNIVGTQVYLDPEYRESGKLKKETDIYSFGVVLFEILCGRLAYDSIYTGEDERGLAPIARKHIKRGTINEMVDPKIMDEVDELVSILCKGPNKNSLNTFINIAYQCVAKSQDKRPTTKSIIEELEKALRCQESHKDNLQMSLEEIKAATQNFSLTNHIGGGGFGKVYKGQVTHANGCSTIIAKRLDKTLRQGEREFLTELEILFEHKHENVIGLVGYCNEKDEKIIVYEYASNLSLDKHLGDKSLSWMTRLKICVDIVRGLEFLHQSTPTKDVVIHRDIKSANVLLNEDWKAKISDFGLSVISTEDQDISKVVGTIGYVDPNYDSKGFLTKEIDIYSLGVVLFEIYHGKLLVPNIKMYNLQLVTGILDHIHDESKFGWIALFGLKKQIAPQSLSTFRMIVSQCLDHEREKRPTAEVVLQQLNKAMEFQEDYEIWEPKLPKDYKDLIQTSKSPELYSTQKNKDFYNMFYKGILLQDDDVWFALGNDHGERIEMVSASKCSYIDHSPHEWRSISESRFAKVAEMLDISNLMIKIETRTHFLSPNVVYGVHLVFKFCDLRKSSSKPMYVNLKYQDGTETLHAYFATRRDDQWMMIELHRFVNHGKRTTFEFMLESMSPYYCGDGAIYVEGIEFRAIHNVKHEEMEQLKPVQQVLRSNLNVDQVQQLPTNDYEETSNKNYHEGEKSYSSEVSGRKHLMLSTKAALYDFSNKKLFISKPSVESRFREVIEFLPQQVFLINCKIEVRMLSPDTNYACYLVFDHSEKTDGLHCPVKVRDMLNRKDEEAEFIYLISPSPWNRHDITQVPKQREDGWMEVNLWKFNSNHDLINDCLDVNLKLISYEGSMGGLIVYGLEFRPL